MPYIPLNRMQTNLYTPGGEFIVANTREGYAGYYYKLYNGLFYSGQTPNTITSVELLPITSPDLSPSTGPVPVVYASDPDLYSSRFEKETTISVNTYRALSKKTANSVLTGYIEVPYYIPTPTDYDYQVGEFIRYFVKKENELKFLEISQQTFQELNQKSSVYNWELYLAFSMPWQISGLKEEVARVNKNITVYTEQRNKIKGLQEFLRFDYLKFYKS